MDEIDQNRLAQVKSAFFIRGEGISEWAHAHGFSPSLVYGVLSGRAKGRRGQAHLIAVELGLKKVPVEPNAELASFEGRSAAR